MECYIAAYTLKIGITLIYSFSILRRKLQFHCLGTVVSLLGNLSFKQWELS